MREGQGPLGRGILTGMADDAPAVDDGERGSRLLAHEIFDPVAAEYLPREGVDIGPMFGSEGLRIRGKVFAFVGYRGALVVKVPAARADELVAAGEVERMVIRDRTLREWIVVGPDRAVAWPPLTAEAFAYVDAITP
ncbi:hypothetical protein Microterr_01110 [Microbacterium terricola]|uniref:TfoX N-terminal domain-containing protein n=2 Tax=Microbacterium terricola TaxID=344163 RepID=A0ABM8DV05_9MICO|nr:hypothetical protein Microterr_01110 [Microbacterium terricola]